MLVPALTTDAQQITAYLLEQGFLNGDLRWWTWAGYRVNATLKARHWATWPTRRSGLMT